MKVRTLDELKAHIDKKKDRLQAHVHNLPRIVLESETRILMVYEQQYHERMWELNSLTFCADRVQ